MADLLLPDFPYFHKFTYVISYPILVHIAMTVIITSTPVFRINDMTTLISRH